MNLYHDLLSKFPKVFHAERKDCSNYILSNMEKAIDLVLLQSTNLQCIICKDRFDSLAEYTTHLRKYKKHVVVFLERKMQTSRLHNG